MSESNKDVFSRIIDVYCTLSRAETLLADYVLHHKHQIAQSSVSQLATACGTSIATVTRFCRSIGCDSFRNFKYEIAQASFSDSRQSTDDEIDLYSEISHEDTIAQKSQKLYNVAKLALSQTLSQLDDARIDEAVTLLTQARNVYCFGQGNSSIISMDAWGRFSSIAPNFHWVPDSHLQADTAAILSDNDVVLFFSFSGMTRELSEIGQLLQTNGAKLILVTRFPTSPGAAYADILLICGADESTRQQGSIAAKISQLFLIDILYHEFCARQPAYTAENRQKVLLASNMHMLGR